MSYFDRQKKIHGLQTWADSCWRLADISKPCNAKQWEDAARKAGQEIRQLKAQGANA